MKKLLAILGAVMMLLPAVLATDFVLSPDMDIDFPNQEPHIWLCDSRKVRDDLYEWGRVSDPGKWLKERQASYAFWGETIEWEVLVLDKNDLKDVEVDVTLGLAPMKGNDFQFQCTPGHILHDGESVDETCNARIGEEIFHVAPAEGVMQYFFCKFEVKSPDVHTPGDYWVTIEAIDLEGASDIIDESEQWYLNPVISLNVPTEIVFQDSAMPGAMIYSDEFQVGNGATDGSGVMLDMFISGTNFLSTEPSRANCYDPITKQREPHLSLGAFDYYATIGAYNTNWDLEIDNWDGVIPGQVERDCDSEGYCNIDYATVFNQHMYDNMEILQQAQVGPYYTANVLQPGAEFTMVLRLETPMPCSSGGGNFADGNLYFWGEAV
jgi:hypothetical protein